MKPKLLLKFPLATLFILSLHHAGAATGTWSDITVGPNNWSDTTKWTSGIVGDGSGFTANFSSNITADTTVTLDTSRTLGNLTLSDNGAGGSRWILASSGGSVLTLDNGASQAVIAKTTSTTIDAQLAGSNIRINGGAGLTLAGNNTGITGNVTFGGVNGVNISNANALGSALVTFAASEVFGGTTTGITIANNVAFSGGVLWYSGGNGIKTTGSVTLSGANQGYENFGSNTFTEWSGNTILGSNRLNVGGGGAGGLIISGNMTGTNGLTKTGASSLTLSGDNSGFSGITTISGGSLRLDYSANNNSKLSSTEALVLNNGAIVRFIGNAGADTTQTINGLTLGTGQSSLFMDTAAGRILTADFTGSGAGIFTGSSLGLYVGTTGSGTAQLKLPGTSANTSFLPNILFNGAFGATDANNFITATGSANNSTASDLSTWTTGATQYITTGSAFTNSVGSGVSIDGITFKDAASRTVTIGTGNTLTLANGIIVAPEVANSNSVITGGSLMASAGGVLNVVNADSQNTLTISSLITDNSGSSMVKNGIGTLTLSGTVANTYTGGTSINGGTISLGTGGTAANTSHVGALGTNTVNINSGGTLKLWIKNDTTHNFTNNLALNNGTVRGEDGIYNMSGTVSLAGANIFETVYSGKNLNFSNTISGTGSLTIRGGGATNLSGNNSYSGGTTLQNGGLTIGHASALGTGTVTVATTASKATDAAAMLNTSSLSSGSIVANAITLPNDTTASNRGLFMNGTGNANITLELSGKISGGSANTTLFLNNNTSGSVNPQFILSNATNDFRGNIQINRGGLRIASNAALGNSANTVTFFSNDGADLTFLNSMTYGRATTLSSRTDFDTGANTVTATGVISGGSSLTKIGSGTLAISTQATYTGGTTIAANSGILDLTGGGGSAGTIRGTITVNSGGTLRLSTGDATGYATDTTRLSVINLAGGTLNINSTANQTLGSAVINMTGGSITGVTGSNLDFFAGASALNTLASATESTISNTTLTLRQSDTTFNIANGAAANDLVVNSLIKDGNAGNKALIKTGAGTMALTAANTYTGNTSVNGGTLAVSNTDGALSNTGAISVNGGTLLLNGSSANRINNAAGISLGGGITASPASKLELGNAAVTETMGALTLSAGTSVMVIDFGDTAFAQNGRLTFASLTGTSATTLQVWNWAGSVSGGGGDQLSFSSTTPGGGMDLANVNFYSDGGNTLFTGAPGATFVGNELVPVPEPGAISASLLLAGFAFAGSRRQAARRRHTAAS